MAQWQNLQKIRSKTAGRSFEEIRPVERQNAVLIPLVEASGELSILFEVRQASIRQGGEICFPGGRIEENETAEEAAVRETSEELLVPRDRIEVIAPMHVMAGPGGAKISSCLGFVRGYEGSFSEREVDHVFTVPLRWFSANRPRIVEASMVVKTPGDFPFELLPGGRNYPWRSIPRSFYFYETDGGVIWGITGQLLYHCLEVLSETMSDFFAQEDPEAGKTPEDGERRL